MPSFLLALLLLFYFYKHSFFAFVQASSISGDIVPYTAPLERRVDLDSNTDTWPLQALKGGDSPLLFSANINQKNVAALTAPNTNSNNFLSIPNNINNNDKPLLSEATTSETSLLLASNTDCRSSSTNDDSTTLESSQQQQQQMAAGQQSPTEKRHIRGRRRRRRRLGEISVVPPPANACPAPLLLPLSPPPPSTPQPQNAQKPPPGQKIKKKKKTTAPPNANDPPQPDGNTGQQPQPPPPSSADLNWDQEMYPSLFRIPTDGYTEGGYNPNCIMKTDGLLPLGVCDSGNAEDVQGSARDLYGNHVDAEVFLDSVAFKLERCGLARTLANSCQQAKSKFWCCKEFEVVDGVGVADICLQLAAVEGKFYQ